MAKTEIDLSIVIVSMNIEDLLRKCLSSVFSSLKGVTHEVIVVDNNSRDKTPEMVAKEFPQVKLIRKHENRGFGENNNFGLKIAQGKYVLLLNADTEIIDKNVFTEMIEWMENHPKAGVSGCALVNPDKKTYQGSGGSFPDLLKVFAWMTFLDDIPGIDKLIRPYHPLHAFSPLDTNEEYFKSSHIQDWLTGAFYLIRKKALDEVGFFDEDFFLYVEEVDLSYRFVKAGWEIWYLPQRKIVHYGMVTSGSENATIFEMKNLKIFYKKHYSKWQIPLLSFILKLGCLLRIVVFGILKGSNIAKIYAKALISV